MVITRAELTFSFKFEALTYVFPFFHFNLRQCDAQQYYWNKKFFSQENSLKVCRTLKNIYEKLMIPSQRHIHAKQAHSLHFKTFRRFKCLKCWRIRGPRVCTENFYLLGKQNIMDMSYRCSTLLFPFYSPTHRPSHHTFSTSTSHLISPSPPLIFLPLPPPPLAQVYQSPFSYYSLSSPFFTFSLTTYSPPRPLPTFLSPLLPSLLPCFPLFFLSF